MKSIKAEWGYKNEYSMVLEKRDDAIWLTTEHVGDADAVSIRLPHDPNYPPDTVIKMLLHALTELLAASVDSPGTQAPSAPPDQL